MTLILVSGVPASGKSTMAAYLSEKLDIPMYSKDRIKELLYDTVGFEGRAQKVKLGVAAMEILYDIARVSLRRGQSVILENNFENASRDGLERLIDECGCHVLTIMMKGDWHALYERFRRRNTCAERHLGHVVNDCYPPRAGGQTRADTMPFEAFEHDMRARGMDLPPVQGPCIEVDTTSLDGIDMAAVAQRVRAQLTAWEQACAAPTREGR